MTQFLSAVSPHAIEEANSPRLSLAECENYENQIAVQFREVQNLQRQIAALTAAIEAAKRENAEIVTNAASGCLARDQLIHELKQQLAVETAYACHLARIVVFGILAFGFGILAGAAWFVLKLFGVTE